MALVNQGRQARGGHTSKGSKQLDLKVRPVSLVRGLCGQTPERAKAPSIYFLGHRAHTGPIVRDGLQKIILSATTKISCGRKISKN